jgi:hypothetical protein
MKNTPALVLLLFVLLAVVLTNCADKVDAVPSCLQVEVVGEDCENGWFVLRILDTDGASEQRSNQYIGQLQSGYVTTDNLPEELQVPGRLLQLSLERNSAYGPRCLAIYMMYPPVRVKEVCSNL